MKWILVLVFVAFVAAEVEKVEEKGSDKIDPEQLREWKEEIKSKRVGDYAKKMIAAHSRCVKKIQKELKEEVSSEDKITLEKMREWIKVGNSTLKEMKFNPCMAVEFPVPHRKMLFKNETIACFVSKCNQTRFWVGEKRRSTARELAWFDLCLLDCAHDKVMSKCSKSSNKNTKKCSYAGWDKYIKKDATNTADAKKNKVDTGAVAKEEEDKGEAMSAKKGKVALITGNEGESFNKGSINGNDLSWFYTLNL